MQATEVKSKGSVAMFSFPENLDEAISVYGKPVVWGLFLQKLTTCAQVVMRSGGDPTDWKPTVGRVKKSAADKAETMFATMSPEEQAAFVKRLKDIQSGKA